MYSIAFQSWVLQNEPKNHKQKMGLYFDRGRIKMEQCPDWLITQTRWDQAVLHPQIWTDAYYEEY